MAAPPAELSLVRLAIFRFNRIIPQGPHTVPRSDVELQAIWGWKGENEAAFLFAALVPLLYRPKIDGDGYAVIPPREREKAEIALLRTADLIATATVTARQVFSAQPSVAFRIDGPAGAEHLARSIGIAPTKVRIQQSPKLDFELDQPTADALADRFDGLALVAEALASRHASAQIREFVRVFERAFMLPAGKLAAPLAAFLNPTFCYTPTEVEGWLRLRHKLSHADTSREVATVLEAVALTERMRQAAYDVLLNKVTWRNPSTDRRALWVPEIGLTSPSGIEARVLRGEQNKIMALFPRDPYGVFPIDVRLELDDRPREWWPSDWWPWGAAGES